MINISGMQSEDACIEILFFGLEILVPQHTLPVEGQDTIKDIVTAYRDAIQYVHDQTVRYMKKTCQGWRLPIL